MPLEPDVMTLGEVGTGHSIDVYIPAIDSPELIYVRLGVMEDR